MHTKRPTKRKKASDDGGDENPEGGTSAKKIRDDVEEGADRREKDSTSKNRPIEGGEETVVSEVGVFLLAGTSDMSINRLQFPQQHPYSLRHQFQSDGTGSGAKCFAHYKSQVKHLRLGFGDDQQDVLHQHGYSNHAYAGGIAPEALARSAALPSNILPQPSAESSSSLAYSLNSNAELYAGEGFSQHGVLSHAVGFFNAGRLFLLPVDKTYDMRKPLTGILEKEAVRTAQKTESVALRQQSSATTVTTSGPNMAPLRVRYARPESDLQRRRREQSSFYKQKLVEQDQWIRLKVEQKKVAQMYGREINQVLSSAQTSSSSANFASSLSEQQN